MNHIRLGRTHLMATEVSFGAIPIQRLPQAEAVYLVRKAFDNGVNLFDSARSYTDSEEKLGLALEGVRDKAIIATKSISRDRENVLKDLETSLRLLKTDYIDIYQLHQAQNTPNLEDPNEPYLALLEARKAGKVRFLGLSAHKLHVALGAVECGLFDTVQYPLSYISTPEELDLIRRCRERDLGVIAMKGLAGGLLSDAAAAFAFLRQYDNLVPIWGMQRETELEEFLRFAADPPVLNEELWKNIEKDRAELREDFCRGCGYCLPCPAGIPIPTAARMTHVLQRMPLAQFLTEDWREQMGRINECQECGHCREHCPYQLDTPALLKKMYGEYTAFMKSRQG